MRNNQAGVTLLEIILVIAIGALLLLMSVRQYLFFAQDKDVDQAQYNVNALFQALNQFYAANCNTPFDTPLDPKKTSSRIEINDDLIKGGFLTQTLPLSVYAYSTDGDWRNGYVVQFNNSSQDRKVCTQTDCGDSAPIGKVLSSISQVAMRLDPEVAKDPQKAEMYLLLLKGNCLSSLSGDTVRPCGENSGSDYIVWQQTPSFSSAQLKSNYWSTNPVVKQFNQMYTTYPYSTLIENGGKTVSDDTQYFFCGN